MYGYENSLHNKKIDELGENLIWPHHQSKLKAKNQLNRQIR